MADKLILVNPVPRNPLLLVPVRVGCVRAGSAGGRYGVTLVELTLTIAILGVLAALAVPRYGLANSRYRTEAASRRVAADLQAARSQALATSTSVTVNFDTVTEKYTISMPDPDKPAQNYAVDLTRDPYTALIVSATIGSGATLTFNGFGLPTAGGSVVLRSGNSTSTLTINADTGAVSYVLQ